MIDPALLSILRCPVSGTPLELSGGQLVSESGARYPIVHGVPVLLASVDDPTLWVAAASFSAAREDRQDEYYIDTLGILPEHVETLRDELERPTGQSRDVDPVISFLVRATCGFMYEQHVGKLQEPPIPRLRLGPGPGRLIDLGCNWGRWCVAAARQGWRPVGVDPSLGGVLAARRLCQRLGLDADFVVGDARRLPFATGTFDAVFSYSVLQHLSYENAELCVAEASRVAKPGCELLIQMPNTFGIRCLYHQVRRSFRPPQEFEVRYYTPRRLRRLVSGYGTPTLEVDGFFGLGIQPSDRHMFSRGKRLIVDCSEVLRKTSRWLPAVKYLADSLYVRARRRL